VGVIAFFGVAFLVGSQLSLVTQIVESDGHRTTEYGALGASFPLRNQNIPDLAVTADVVAHIGAIAPPPANWDIARPDMAIRITRPSNTEWTLQSPYRGSVTALADYYRKHLTGATVESHGGMTSVYGKGRDGSDVSIWISPRGTGSPGESAVGFKVVSRF
jgi:hypothetical protein